jgi:hypothetical protein
MTAPTSVRPLPLALPLAALATLTSALATGVGAQSILLTRIGEKANDRFGAIVRDAGDVDGDGRPDIAVGAPEDGFVLGTGEGFVRIYSGMSGAVIRTLHGTVAQEMFGSAAAGLGDVNGDGRADIAVGSPVHPGGGDARGLVQVFSGWNGSLLWSAGGQVNGDRHGSVVAAAGDMNLDGISEVIAGSREASGGGTARGRVEVYDGLSGAPLHTLTGSSNNQRLGLSVAGVGDVNGDGRADFAIASLNGGVRIHSGLNASILRTFTAPALDDVFGASLAGIGDLTGDGIRELLVGATDDGNIFGIGTGYVHVYNLASGALVRTLTGSVSGDRFGVAVADARDLNGDGRPEILVGADQNVSALRGYARLFDGASGNELHTFQGLAEGDRFGASVAGLGNVDGAGPSELAIGAPNHTTSFTFDGRVEVWTAAQPPCPAPTNFCIATANSTGFPAQIGSTGSTSVSANDMVLTCSALPPNSSGLFYYGPNQIQQAFGNGWRCVGGSVVRFGVQPISGAGTVTRPLNFPALSTPILPGSTWKFQFWYRNALGGGAGHNLSNGLSVTFCN